MHKTIQMFQLMKLMKGSRLKMLLAITFGTIANLSSTLLIVIASLVLVQYLGLLDIIDQNHISLYLLMFVFGRILFKYLEQWFNHDIAFKVLADLRDVIFAKMRELTPAKMMHHEKGDLVALVTSDVESLEVFYAHTISPVGIYLLYSILAMIFVGFIHLYLMIFIAISYIVIGVILPIYNNKMTSNLGELSKAKNATLNTLMINNLEGVREINQYQQENKAYQYFKMQNDLYQETQKKLTNKFGKTQFLSQFLVSVFMLSYVVLAIHLNINKGLLFLSIMFYISSFGPALALANVSQNLSYTFASGRRLLKLLDENPTVNETLGHMDMIGKRLDVKNINFAYDKNHVIKNLSLKVEKPQLIGIMGPSGCGKSTLLHLLMHYFEVNQGIITFDDIYIKNIKIDSLREHVSIVSQNTYLFDTTIKENIRLANVQADEKQIEQVIMDASLELWIDSLSQGINSMVGDLGSQISSGERQRIGLARALLRDTPILLLDEFTSNLDALNEGIILNKLATIKDKIVIIVSHRESTLNICDTTYYFKKGSLFKK